MTQSGLSPDEKSSFISSQAVRLIHHCRHHHRNHKVLSALCFNQPHLPGGDVVWQMLRFSHEPKTQISKHIERKTYNGGDNTPVMLLGALLARQCGHIQSHLRPFQSLCNLIKKRPFSVWFLCIHTKHQKGVITPPQCVSDSEVVFCI